MHLSSYDKMLRITNPSETSLPRFPVVSPRLGVYCQSTTTQLCVKWNGGLLTSKRNSGTKLSKRKHGSNVLSRNAGDGDPSFLATIVEGDVVEYSERAGADGKVGHGKLGVVVNVFSKLASTFCEVEPLRQEEPGSNEWVEDEDEDRVCVALDQVRIIDAWPSQRMDRDRVSNPHGEHAHNVWLIDPPS